jgi:hypothetical protein
VTHFHMDISCHVNPIGPTTHFGTQNKSRHFKLRDYESRHAFGGVTHFGSISKVCFNYHLLFFYN